MHRCTGIEKMYSAGTVCMRASYNISLYIVHIYGGLYIYIYSIYIYISINV